MYRIGIFALALSLFGVINLSAQCDNWNNLANKDALEGYHSVYRQALKSGDMAVAYENWQKVFDKAPTADGLRDFHFTDGIKMYMDKFNNTDDEAKKTEYREKVEALYEECATCYEAQKIKLKKCGDDQDCFNKRIGYLMGRKGYDMYYYLNSPYEENRVAFEKAVILGGNDTEYIVLHPYAAIAVFQYQAGDISKEQAREVHRLLNELADYNISQDNFAAEFEQARAAANGEFSKVEDDLFDCSYFKVKYEPEYRDDQSPENAKYYYNILKTKGCDNSDPLMAELKGHYEKYAAQLNAQLKADYEANNPAILANKAYKAGNYNDALAKYKEAIASETDNARKARYHFSMASIYFRKLKQYSTARNEARTAANLNPSWGRPYMLIGDMYASTARSCGDSWNQRLAILAATDKWSKGKSIDSAVASEASSKISKYSSSRPLKEDGFVRGVSEGASARVGCWIGESVTVRY